MIATLTLLGLAGCGTLRPADPAVIPDIGPTTFDQAAGPAGGALSPRGPGEFAALPSSPTFPLTLRRTGGIADFDDTVVLANDGQLTVHTPTLSERVCSLPTSLRHDLLSALGTIRMAGSQPTRPPSAATGAESSDPGESTPTQPITITVTDLHDRPVDLSDPSLGRVASMVGALVADVTLTTPALTTCHDGASPPSLPATAR